MPGIPARGLRPASELAADRLHGERLRYVGGCRCELCRAANTRYENGRRAARKAGDWNGVVPADRARAHIRKLKKHGLGRRAIAEAAGVREQMVWEIRKGRKLRLRARAERRILAVTKEMISDRALVPAKRLWDRINQLLEEGYTKTFIKDQLGYKSSGLQFNRSRVTARNRENVERLYLRLTA